MTTTTYDRPVPAKLVVHLDNGETWDATEEDLANFGYVSKFTAYRRFEQTLRTTLINAGLIDRKLTEAQLNPLRHLIEVALVHPEMLDHPEHTGWSDVVEIERLLSEHAAELTTRQDTARQAAEAQP